MTITVPETGCHAHPYASDTAPGMTELATDAEVIAGTDAERVVTPASLNAWAEAYPALDPATETSLGVVELATTAESVANPATNDALAITPYILGRYLGNLPTASISDSDLLHVHDTTSGQDVAVAFSDIITLLRSEFMSTITLGDSYFYQFFNSPSTGVIVSAAANTNGVHISEYSIGSYSTSVNGANAFTVDGEYIGFVPQYGASTTALCGGPLFVPAGKEVGYAMDRGHAHMHYTVL